MDDHHVTPEQTATVAAAIKAEAPTTTTATLKEIPVQIEHFATIHPAKRTPNATFYVSNVDHTVVFMVDSIYFYPYHPHAHQQFEKAPEVLEAALAQALIAFYPFTGKLIFDNSTQRLQLQCDQTSRAFFAVAATELSIKDLGDLNVPNPHFRNLVFTPKNISSLSETPLLTIQITKFKCGGFSLSFSQNHAVTDGVGSTKFQQYYSAITSGHLPPPPELHIDRTLLKARSPPTPTYDFGDAYYKSSEVPNTKSFTTMEDMLNSNLHDNYVVTNLVSKVIKVSSSMIDALKREALSDKTLKKCSTFDVLSAYLWKKRTEAVGMKPDQQSIMFMAVDVTNKLNPPLPKSFFGNRALPVFARLTAQELFNLPLSFCVQKVQEALGEADDEYVRSWIDWSEIHRGIPRFNGGFYLSSWWKFPFYDLDFGWGKPAYMGPVLTQRVEFVLILPVSPTNEEGGVEVLLTLEPHQMDKLQEIIHRSFPKL